MIARLTLTMAAALAIAASAQAASAAARPSLSPLAFALSASAQPPATTPSGGAPPGQTEFVPLNELPPSEQLPAAPLLVTAYSVFLILMVFYVWTVWVRLSKVEAEMRTLEQRTMNHGR
jgi:hypothetical protein